MPKAVTSHDRRQEVEYDRANHEIHGTTRMIGVANSHNSIHKTRPLSLFAIMRLLIRSSSRRHMSYCIFGMLLLHWLPLAQATAAG